MAKITAPQDIPSGLQKGYSAALSTKETGEDILHIRRRPPFRIGTLQGCREIRPPIPRGSKVSDAMCAQRHMFCECVKCFQIQPLTGGAVPPATGPRNRSWWFNDAIPSGWWYFCWFMKKTLDLYTPSYAPVWCKRMVAADTFAEKSTPDGNWGDWSYLGAQKVAGQDKAIAFIKRPADDVHTLHLHVAFQQGNGWSYNQTLEIWEVTEDWDEYTLTWNNQPALGTIQAVKVVPLGNGVWIDFVVGDVASVAIKVIEANGDISFHSREYDEGWEPYWTA